ncbi:proteasome alpha subunit [Natrialba magadii ATCC 43099]|uniref:Proteasome subunit alpha n=1 Tax=Natrialba magadii (strain ATCC 43099 / DSM 3394 / CCM 3739 / CIP 104546 / IAM 13178 / JCM 8861 / NBRC 102185 / NCIMB 2190 / MS3) TaxID=547559 RepID=D3SYJ1_NATMM|nr:archaeal proteasome endopeptidase complex subunit alpha [Natrialba magadii]ADD04102.1 proteasome alpha subunit [Natrialba magadii ATCC 43099]ELY33259.1 proteasome subunit alpha [Natrialba magadii ATCC 43099]
MDSSTTRQQAYDRGHTIFSPDGRLYQVEYAREAVERGSPSVGVVTDTGVVLAARKRLRSPLLESESIEKIHRVDDHVAVATAGHAADARQLVEMARKRCQRHRLRYAEPIPTETLAEAIADHIQEQTQAGGTRPYGAALLVAGVDAGRGRKRKRRKESESGSGSGSGSNAAGQHPQPALYEVDPGGTHYGWRATAIGNGTADIRSFLEGQLADSGAECEAGVRKDGLSLALESLAAGTSETDTELSPETVDGLVLTPDTVADRAGVVDGAEVADVLGELE